MTAAERQKRYMASLMAKAQGHDRLKAENVKLRAENATLQEEIAELDELAARADLGSALFYLEKKGVEKKEDQQEYARVMLALLLALCCKGKGEATAKGTLPCGHGSCRPSNMAADRSRGRSTTSGGCCMATACLIA